MVEKLNKREKVGIVMMSLNCIMILVMTYESLSILYPFIGAIAGGLMFISN